MAKSPVKKKDGRLYHDPKVIELHNPDELQNAAKAMHKKGYLKVKAFHILKAATDIGKRKTKAIGILHGPCHSRKEVYQEIYNTHTKTEVIK